MRFSGKVGLVTGAGSGIGAATAVLLAEKGASVALVDINETRLGNVEQQCSQHGAQTLIIKADLAKEEEASTIVQKTVERFGKLDVLVNNAGIFRPAAVSDPNVLQVFDEVFNINLRAVIQLTNQAVPHLVATKGNVVNVSSCVTRGVFRLNYMPYAVSKAGVDHFTRYAALDLSEFGIRVNSVNLGPVRTNILENSGSDTVSMDELVGDPTKALAKVADPVDIAEAIAFLASDKARNITGSNYLSDNGHVLKRNS